MKVLVTGGAGFIGSNVVKLLESQGAKVIILDDFSHAGYKNLLNKTNADIICADILDENIYKKLPKLDAVIHEAAVTDTTLPDDRKMVMVNFEGFKNVFSFCQKNKIKLVYASSAGVYGNATNVMTESQTLTPHNIYGYSKCLCDWYMNKNIKKTSSLAVGLRYFNVFGPGEYHKQKSSSMIFQLYLQMKEGRRPRIFKYGEQERDHIYVKDVARITVESLKLKKSTVLNVGTGQARTFNDIVAALNKSLKTSLEPDYFDNPYTGHYQDFTCADTAQLDKLKLSTKFTLETGVDDYIKNHLSKNEYL